MTKLKQETDNAKNKTAELQDLLATQLQTNCELEAELTTMKENSKLPQSKRYRQRTRVVRRQSTHETAMGQTNDVNKTSVSPRNDP